MKKAIKVSVFCASVLAAATSAQALDLNIYGASAQYEFWKDEAPLFLQTPVANGGMGCDVATVKFGTLKYTNPINGVTTDNGAAVGFNCQGAGGQTVNIRYSSNKSVEGPRAVMNMDPQENDTCITGNPTSDNLREMLTIDAAGVKTMGCHDVNLGASDVASEAFTQESHGFENGIYNQTDFNEVLDPATIPGASTPGMTYWRPIVVPFSFFANTALTDTNNLTRLQAVLLMSGNVSNWDQFGYTSNWVVSCMRHAGSGTHATLDKAVMRGDKALANTQFYLPFPAPTQTILFHTSSSELSKCVNENALKGPGYVAVGYADTDKIVKSIAADGSEVNTSYPSVKRLTYNGAGMGKVAGSGTSNAPIKGEIANGIYDFWSAQWIYMDKAHESTAVYDAANTMMTFASKAANLPTAKKYYWLAAEELNVSKENDSVLPHF
ncbi:MAG: substrate-binding domain-containing protein [Sulfuricella sp.]|jgi:ABC-type phosphate transport system substrate-binding protein